MSRSKLSVPTAKLPTFLWGAATAAHQVEGNQRNDWSEWEATVADGLAADAERRLKAKGVPDDAALLALARDPQNYLSADAADHYHRYRQDFDILYDLGCNAYRFSVEWARIEPRPGEYDQRALDHYRDMVRELKKRGITPMITLHHFTNPTWLAAHGGWHGREVVERFAQFSTVVAGYLGPDVTYWCSINEPGSYLLVRYLGGDIWPRWPGGAFRPLDGYRYLRNVVQAHRAARRAIKAANPAAQVGVAHGMVHFELARHDPVSWVMKKLLEYIPDTYLLNRLKHDLDYIGVQYYIRMQVAARLGHPAHWTSYWVGQEPRSHTGWGIYPEGLYHITQRLKRYGLPQIVTENGIADANDLQRAGFIREHIAALDRSRADGADIRGYFYWSLLDNYEWSEGFWPQFGLVAVDRKTQQRTVRPSAKVYAQIIRQHLAASKKRPA
ncbi:MAG TPA: family 1 glycosylhydrolase [Candidatus Saccharimonadales bacterium]|nr:family 1 glycosylhydrolase [Candidatus Saccharimonadales bacterium]